VTVLIIQLLPVVIMFTDIKLSTIADKCNIQIGCGEMPDVDGDAQNISGTYMG
jgi:hypothetical protein